MLTELFDDVHSWYRSLPLLGPILDDFDHWLAIHGYAPSTRQNYIMYCAHIAKYLQRRRVRTIVGISAQTIARSRQYFKVRPGRMDYAVGFLQVFLEEQQLLTRTSRPASVLDSSALPKFLGKRWTLKFGPLAKLGFCS